LEEPESKLRERLLARLSGWFQQIHSLPLDKQDKLLALFFFQITGQFSEFVYASLLAA
jgi:hypothetical protein